MLHSRSVHLPRIASKLPGRAKKLSRVRQLERLVDNHHISNMPRLDGNRHQ